LLWVHPPIVEYVGITAPKSQAAVSQIRILSLSEGTGGAKYVFTVCCTQPACMVWIPTKLYVPPPGRVKVSACPAGRLARIATEVMRHTERFFIMDHFGYMSAGPHGPLHRS
jgi:hypothetical protein